MVLDIKMCRFDNVPWGFRLVGGSDFELPLTVVKVTEGSIAEEAGLQVGDVIVRIDDTAATPLTHDEAHKIIMHCGNVFYFGISREDSEEEKMPKQFPTVSFERPSTAESYVDVGSFNAYSEDARSNDEYLADLCDRPNSALSEHSEIKLVEEEIAAVLSGESEVLKDHNVMGIFPKPGVCMSSDVLRTLNEEATKTKAEKDKENKKWTTFLQKPNRPIPRSKAQIEAERRAANAYKVKITKSERRSLSPAVEIKPVEPEPPKEPSPPKPPTPPTEQQQQPAEEEAPPTDSEVPNLEGTAASGNGQEQTVAEENVEHGIENEEEKADKEKEASPETKEAMPEQQASEAEANSRELTPSNKSPTEESERAKTAEELALERQLADVQKQLQALSSLPSTIQATLDAVTKQLGELLPTFKLQQVQLTKEEPREINLECIEEAQEETKEMPPDETAGEDMEVEDKPLNVEDSNKDEEFDSNLARDIDDYYELETQDPVKQQANLERQEETRQMEQEQNLKKQKRHDVIEELEVHLERKNNPKQQRSKRAFGPLTPSSERPLVLPGGRRWYRPKDAYNDEFIAETLSAQAELITGTTLGEYHGASVSLQFELDRVNFMKYQKPERKIDLDRSEVYKIIHHLDRKPVRGIEVRAPVVPAAVDIRKTVQS